MNDTEEPTNEQMVAIFNITVMSDAMEKMQKAQDQYRTERARTLEMLLLDRKKTHGGDVYAWVGSQLGLTGKKVRQMTAKGMYEDAVKVASEENGDG